MSSDISLDLHVQPSKEEKHRDSKKIKGKTKEKISPSQPEFVTSAKGLSHLLHWRPITPGLH